MFVGAVNNSGVNSIPKQVNFNGHSTGNNSKNRLNAKDLILGSLAAVAVLGISDILICKGKHLNKFISKAKNVVDAPAAQKEVVSHNFDPSKFDRAAYDAKLDKSLITWGNDYEDVLKRRIRMHGNRRAEYNKNGKLESITYYDPVTDVSKVEEFATHACKEYWTKVDPVSGKHIDVAGRIFKEGDIVTERYYKGCRLDGNHNNWFLELDSLKDHDAVGRSIYWVNIEELYHGTPAL